MPELQAAYKNFLESWQAYNDARNSEGLGRLLGRIGQVQKEQLPWFSLCLFCNPAHHSQADYTKAPYWTCYLADNSELNLDLLGSDSIYSLYKGGGQWTQCSNGKQAMPGPRKADSAAFARQCEVLSSELDKTIKEFGLDVPDHDNVVLAKPAL